MANLLRIKPSNKFFKTLMQQSCRLHSKYWVLKGDHKLKMLPSSSCNMRIRYNRMQRASSRIWLSKPNLYRTKSTKKIKRDKRTKGSKGKIIRRTQILKISNEHKYVIY